MANQSDIISDGDSDSDDLLDNSWSLSKRKKIKILSVTSTKNSCIIDMQNKTNIQAEKFEDLKKKSSQMKFLTALRRQKTELRRSRRLVKKALTDPWVKELVEKNQINNESTTTESGSQTSLKWDDVKPFLTANDHLHGPVSHGDCGPKTELEYLVEDCIKEGDFEKAELLSDTLANREFAVKISHAFAVKRYQEKLQKEKAEEKQKPTKIRWMFDAKERWQMKGNM